MDLKNPKPSDEYEQLAADARSDAEGHVVDMDREPNAFLKSIHKRKADQAKQSESHFRDQAQKARERGE